MLKIGKGRARDLGTKFWEITGPANARLTHFNHKRFPNILDQAPVYFLDLDLDPRYCENVQSAHEVDGFVAEATPAGGGIETEAALRIYVMAALLTALGKQGTARSDYLDLLHAKMRDVAGAGLAAPQGRVTMTELIALGIAA